MTSGARPGLLPTGRRWTSRTTAHLRWSCPSSWVSCCWKCSWTSSESGSSSCAYRSRCSTRPLVSRSDSHLPSRAHQLLGASSLGLPRGADAAGARNAKGHPGKGDDIGRSAVLPRCG